MFAYPVFFYKVESRAFWNGGEKGKIYPFAYQALQPSSWLPVVNKKLHRVHVIQFAELAAVNFLHSIHPAKVAAANSANTVLAGQICAAKTANSRRRLTIIHSGISGSDVSSIHEWNSSFHVFSNWATRNMTQLTVCMRFALGRFATAIIAAVKRWYPIACSHSQSCHGQTAISNRVQS